MENQEQKKDMASIYNFFEHFIKEGRVYKEKEVAPKFKVKLKALNSEEILKAESVVVNATSNTLLSDIAIRIRACAILSYAIVELNGESVYTEDEMEGNDNKSMESKRVAIYQMLLKLPPQILTSLYDVYLEAVQEQNELYSDASKVKEATENFSTHPSAK